MPNLVNSLVLDFPAEKPRCSIQAKACIVCHVVKGKEKKKTTKAILDYICRWKGRTHLNFMDSLKY